MDRITDGELRSILDFLEGFRHEQRELLLGRIRFGGIVAEPWKLRAHKIST